VCVRACVRAACVRAGVRACVCVVPTSHIQGSLSPARAAAAPQAVQRGGLSPVHGQVHRPVKGHQLHRVEVAVVHGFHAVYHNTFT